MIVADASALVALASARALGPAIEAFGLHTTDLVVESIEAESAFHGPAGGGPRAALTYRAGLVVHRGDREAFASSRVDRSQGSCVRLAVARNADVLLTDDLPALAELRRLTPRAVGIPPVVLRALVRRGVLARQDAQFRLEALAGSRDWLGRPVYRRALESPAAAG